MAVRINLAAASRRIEFWGHTQFLDACKCVSGNFSFPFNQCPAQRRTSRRILIKLCKQSDCKPLNLAMKNHVKVEKLRITHTNSLGQRFDNYTAFYKRSLVCCTQQFRKQIFHFPHEILNAF